ncbi:MAG: outer membrane protein transport protein [Phascolarctobacterium faecium]
MFLKKHFTIIGLACVLSVPAVDAGAEGFAINEWSAEGVAMGGARMFAENDAANIAYNPASITKVRGEAFKQSAVYISPHGKYKAYDDQECLLTKVKRRTCRLGSRQLLCQTAQRQRLDWCRVVQPFRHDLRI